VLQFLRAHPNEQFEVDELSEKVGSSSPTVSKHLKTLGGAEIVACDEGRPAKYRLRTLWPMGKQLVEMLQETLAYASPDRPPDAVTLQLSENKHFKTEVTVVWTGKEYSRRYQLIVNSEVSIEAAAKVTRQ
jgi:hypothetical protein